MRAHCAAVSPRSFWNGSDFHHANDDCAPSGAASASSRKPGASRRKEAGLMRKPLKSELLLEIRRTLYMYFQETKYYELSHRLGGRDTGSQRGQPHARLKPPLPWSVAASLYPSSVAAPAFMRAKITYRTSLL